MKVNSKKGFTIVELVVALAIITIVSATAIGIINVQNTVYLRTVQTVEATNIAENAIECFRWADDANEFEAAFKKTLNENEITRGDESPYTFEKNGMTVTITIEGSTLTFKAVADNDRVILERSYTK